MNDVQLLDPQAEEGALSFARRFVRSEGFMLLFREGMGLVEQTAAYLDGDGRKEAAALPREIALTYATESMRLTTRLMQIASWLLVQRAVREGDMTPEAAGEPRYRLNERKIEREPSHSELPIALVEYLVRADKLFERTVYLDRRMYLGEGEPPAANPVLTQMDRLQAAFGR